MGSIGHNHGEPPARSSSRATGADRPAFDVIPTSQWYARITARQPTLWQRLIGRHRNPMPLAVLPRCTPEQASAAFASPAHDAASPSPTIAAVEAGGDQPGDHADG